MKECRCDETLPLITESIGSNFHAGSGSLTESGRRVRIRDRRRRPVRAFPAGREGPVFFQVMSLSLWTEFEHVVKLNGGLWLYTILPPALRKATWSRFSKDDV
jgi:hypothetical protein